MLVTGSGGQIAKEYEMSRPLSDWDYLFLSRKDLDITKLTVLEEIFHLYPFDAVLNLAAYTNVEKAEQEETEKCFNVNANGPKNLAIICNRFSIPLIHISSDYVFDGKKGTPYRESDLENPINDYGRTKFVGEKWIQENHDWYYIIRTSWVYSNHSDNFYTKILNLTQERTELNIVEDQFGSPTSSKEVCRAIDAVINRMEKSFSGTYHFAGLGRTSWKEFTEEILIQTKISIKVNGISSISWKSKVNRPVDTYMSSEKFINIFSYRPLHWKLALREIVLERKIVPIKVGDIVAIKDSVEHIIVATDWLKRIAKLSPLTDMKTIIELPFDILTI